MTTTLTPAQSAALQWFALPAAERATRGPVTGTRAALVSRGLITPAATLSGHQLTETGREAAGIREVKPRGPRVILAPGEELVSNLRGVVYRPVGGKLWEVVLDGKAVGRVAELPGGAWSAYDTCGTRYAQEERNADDAVLRIALPLGLSVSNVTEPAEEPAERTQLTTTAQHLRRGDVVKLREHTVHVFDLATDAGETTVWPSLTDLQAGAPERITVPADHRVAAQRAGRSATVGWTGGMYAWRGTLRRGRTIVVVCPHVHRNREEGESATRCLIVLARALSRGGREAAQCWVDLGVQDARDPERRRAEHQATVDAVAHLLESGPVTYHSWDVAALY